MRDPSWLQRPTDQGLSLFDRWRLDPRCRSLFLKPGSEVTYSKGDFLWLDYIHQMMRSNGIQARPHMDLFRVATVNGQIVGAIFINISWLKTFSFDVAVDVGHRHQGIGTELVRLAIEEYRKLKEESEQEYIMVEVITEEMKRILERFDLRVHHTKTDKMTGRISYYMTDIEEDEDDSIE